MRALAIAAVLAQARIAVTGSVVRVTGSGLGCPTGRSASRAAWCPIAQPETQALTQWIEFGNRLLTVAVVIVAAACLVAALATRPRRRAAHPAGARAAARRGRAGRHRRDDRAALARVVVGAVHFIVSMVMVWLAVQLVAAGRTTATSRRPPSRRPVRGLITTSAAVLAGLPGRRAPVVTSRTQQRAATRGPEGSDLPVGLARGAARRPALRLPRHAGRARLRAARRRAPAALLRRLGCSSSRWSRRRALGLTRYALGVPEALVSLHVLGAASRPSAPPRCGGHRRAAGERNATVAAPAELGPGLA